MAKIQVSRIDPIKNFGCSFQLDYLCECGKPMSYLVQSKPKRLMKCPDCLEKEGSIFEDDELFMSEKKSRNKKACSRGLFW